MIQTRKMELIDIGDCFLGAVGAIGWMIVPLIFPVAEKIDRGKLTIGKVLAHLFFGIVASVWFGPAVCTWRHIIDCDAMQVLVALFSVPVMIALTKVAQSDALTNLIKRFLGNGNNNTK